MAPFRFNFTPLRYGHGDDASATWNTQRYCPECGAALARRCARSATPTRGHQTVCADPLLEASDGASRPNTAGRHFAGSGAAAGPWAGGLRGRSHTPRRPAASFRLGPGRVHQASPAHRQHRTAAKPTGRRLCPTGWAKVGKWNAGYVSHITELTARPSVGWKDHEGKELMAYAVSAATSRPHRRRPVRLPRVNPGVRPGRAFVAGRPVAGRARPAVSATRVAAGAGGPSRILMAKAVVLRAAGASAQGDRRS